jgi:DNA (cytosine-5)-methyltransferase 1
MQASGRETETRASKFPRPHGTVRAYRGCGEKCGGSGGVDWGQNDMKHLGDICKINGALIAPVDVIVGGSPCQDLSVAGKGKGFKQVCQFCGAEYDINEHFCVCPVCGNPLGVTRSGLFMEQIRIVREQRNESIKRSDDPVRPRWMVWENVPGAFSSNKAEDFRIVLEETARVADGDAVIPRPPSGKWTTAGAIMGSGFSIAWRVLDAQFWGVPQRRRRIALVADFGGHAAPEILFERKGLSGDIEASGTEREGTAGDAERGVNDTGGVLRGIDAPVGFSYKASAGAGTIGCADDLAPSLLGARHDAAIAFSFDSLSSNSMKSKNPHSGCRAVDIAKTIDTSYPDPSKNQGGIAVVHPKVTGTICASGAGTDRPAGQGNETDMCIVTAHPTLFAKDGIASTLDASFATKWGLEDQHVNAGCPNFVKQPIAFYQHKFGEYREGAGTLKTNCGQPSNGSGTLAVEKCYPINTQIITRHNALGRGTGFGMDDDGAPAYTLQAGHEHGVATNFAVRRLTPLECERLQGYPDGWTDIPPQTDVTEEDLTFWRTVWDEWDDMNGKKRHSDKQIIKWLKSEAADSARYKALGNSIALPPWRFVLSRIHKYGARTLGSLFDGIGGFPLIWSELPGTTTAWASEIEPFPIAVTTVRLKTEI